MDLVDMSLTSGAVDKAVPLAGRDEQLRTVILDALRQAELSAEDPASFREHVRWPLILSLLSEVETHRVVLKNGLMFEVSPESRIEQALLLSSEAHPDHVWEPQTTKLLVALAAGISQAIVGGAYIGDHVLPLARSLAAATPPPGVVHAFEPMARSYRRLLRNLELNSIRNVVPHQLGLWDLSDTMLNVSGPAGLASSTASSETDLESSAGDNVTSIRIDDYVKSQGLESVGLIMLDIEGGEEKALKGGLELLSRPFPEAPNVVFEIHRQYVDWTKGLENTSIVKLLTSRGYTVFAIRDFHSNYPMAGRLIEIIPVDCVYLEGPTHGFNMLATKDQELIGDLGLRVVENVSPKLLLDRDPALHHPLDGI